jgi:hypothetical protein
MDKNFTREEAEWLLEQLRILGEKAFSNKNQRVVELVNFYWQLMRSQLQASQPLWREAA